jgi:hypothetical protein
VLDLPQGLVEGDEHRGLGQERQTPAERVDLVLLVELHQLFVELLAVALVLALDLLHLRRMRLERLHGVDLAHGQRHEEDADENRQRNDRPGPRQPHGAVEEVENRLHDVLERGEDPRDHHERGHG